MRPLEQRPHSLSPLGLAIAGWAAFVIAGWLFLAIAWDVATHDDIVVFDATLAAWLHEHGSPALTKAMMLVTTLNSTFAVAGWGVAFALVLARLREWYWMLTLALAVVGGLALNVLLKYAYERARPHFDDPWVTLQTFSFPSGHTAGATVFYGVIAAFLVSRTARWGLRAACVAGAIFMVALVGFSRIYLGAHYLSDVLAAACSSTVWLVLCLNAVHALVKRRLGGRR
jgi:membrane-associated phospholipid phosphatase